MRRILFTILVFLFTLTACSILGGATREDPLQPFTPEVGATQTWRDGMTGMYVPEGEFMMGTRQFQHRVYLDAFWIDQTEITNGMYMQCVLDGVCSEPISKASALRMSYYVDPDYQNFPVINVTWRHAQTYCNWAGRRLPTEAEWEKAAHGDIDTPAYPFGWFLLCHQANVKGCVNETTKVGSYRGAASPYGALDMAGNVWEWVQDWFDPTYYNDSPDRNPTGPFTGEYRRVRGGSWRSDDYDLILTNHSVLLPDDANNSTGFRCARGTP